MDGTVPTMLSGNARADECRGCPDMAARSARFELLSLIDFAAAYEMTRIT